MDITTIILIGAVLILLLLVVFMMMMVSKITASPEQMMIKEAKKHFCKECLFCKESGCVYFHDSGIDVERPACKHYEEREEYRPA